MIARLKGLVDRLGDDHAVIDVGGVGYLVQCSGRTLARLGPVGTPARLEIETHVREDAIILYGFLDRAELDLFGQLQTVQGVGARVSLAVLTALSPDEIHRAVATGDVVALSRAQGVGRRLAQRLAAELKEKLGAPPPVTGGAVAPVRPAGVNADAVSALVNLGYRKPEAELAVGRAVAELGDDVAVEALIPRALKELAR